MNLFFKKKQEETQTDTAIKDNNVAQPIKQKIGAKEVTRATEILTKYKSGKSRLEQKIIANEDFWKLRQWNYMNDGKGDFKPATAWLWSCIQGRYSDAMDSYPTCNMQPRQQDDKAEAKKLSAIVPVILEQNRYEDVYSDVVWYTLKNGGSVQGIFWDANKHGGLGDVAIKKIDFINLFWEAGIKDIQASENVFNTELVNNDLLEQKYPQCRGKLGGKSITIAKYLYDDNVDTTDKSVVVDWYYHTMNGNKKILQYVKYVNDIVLYATENETQRPTKQVVSPETGLPLIDQFTGQPVVEETGLSMAEKGLYDHGLYPFVTMALFPVEGSICGYGLTDIGRDTQMMIDLLSKAISDNALAGATPRYFIRNDGGINESEYTDLSKHLVHVEGSLDDNNIRPIDSKPLDSIYQSVLDGKINELKYITANQDSNNGVAPSGVTAASAIAALQETAGKNARSSNKAFHRAYRDVIYQVIELIRQFYDVPRTFRICPDDMGEQFVSYTNAGLVPQPQQIMGMNMGFRVPEFDIDVTSEKANPYKKMEMNELALNFYNQGFFNPQMADQALACLQMMDFTHKDDIMNRIKSNGTMQQMLLQYQQLALGLAQQVNPELANQISQAILQQAGQPVAQVGHGDVDLTEETGGTAEHPYVENARANARESTQAD